MAVASRKRWRVVALGLALAVAGVVAGATGLVAWRRTRPLWTFECGPYTWAPLFLDSGRALAVWHPPPRNEEVYRHVFSLETGAELSALEVGEHFSPLTGVQVRTAPSGELVLDDLLTGASRTLFGLYPPRPSQIGWLSPRGDAIAWEGSGGLEVCRLVNGAVAQVVPLEKSDDVTVDELRFSPDGDRLAVERRETLSFFTVVVWSTRTGMLSDVVWAIRAGTRDGRSQRFLVGFSRTGELVTAIDGSFEHGSSIVVTAADGSERELAHASVRLFSLSASGDRLATIERAPSEADPKAIAVVVRDVKTGETVRRLARTWSSRARSVALSPEGDRLAVVSEGGRVDVWELPPP